MSGESDVPRDGLPGPAPEERPHPEGRRNKQGIRIDPAAEAEKQPRRAVISALVDHEPGVLSRVSGLVSRRQFNIESLTVGPTTVEGHARITMAVEEPDPGIDQIKKQLSKLIPVIAVGELDDDAISTEVALLKVGGEEPDKVHAVTEMYDGTTKDAGPETITVQLTGDTATIDDAVNAFRQFGIIEIARTGPTALAHGSKTTVPGERPAYMGEPTTTADAERERNGSIESDEETNANADRNTEVNTR
ncbi:acetolactate synthase I/III small subunit [Halalkaliarchaeum desulfuricum]|uniref:Acetolactate synthase I/III small subunit n=1 Tax=Halalkaliarchaeum desulfuricum TaxID=2055893 RepID=A0A343TMG1_9EURY|nr:acetolactate synthase I/III small subunit [Halalkaliarchaeum desulfuricum]